MHKTFLTFFCLALLAAPLWVRADVYRCQKGGQIIYSDQPCAPGAKRADLPANTVIPADRREKSLAHHYDRRLEKQSKARSRADAKWIKAHRARESREQRIRAATIEGRVVVGMTPGQVRRVLGDPLKVSHSETKSRSGEIWTYRDAQGRRTIRFRDGRVTSIRTRRRGR